MARHQARMQRHQARMARHFRRIHGIAGMVPAVGFGLAPLFARGLCGARWSRHRALASRRFLRQRRFARTLQVLLGFAIIMFVLLVRGQQDDDRNNSWITI
jgi:hypothetical protein